jgi:6-phosphogluconolactonase
MRILFIIASLFCCVHCLSQDKYLFIGTYTGKGSKGIYVYRFNASTGDASWVSNTDSAIAPNPSFLSVSPNGKFLYAVYEEGGQKNGQVSAFSFNRSTGALLFLNKQPSGGDHPCFVASTRDNKWVLTGNYTGGSLGAFRTNRDGSLQPSAQVIQHKGSSVNTARQEKPHVHSTFFSPAEDHVLVPDLGTDKVMIYKFNPSAKEPLSPAPQAFAASEPGSGPRHLTFSPNGRFVYVIEELTGAVAVHSYNKGKLSFVQKEFTHPKEFKGKPGSADIHISPDGKFLYASNRGEENNLAIFSVNPANGKISHVGYQPTMGSGPRNFMIDPSGRFLLVANQNSNNVVIFKRDTKTGLLTPISKEIQVPNPVCLKML